MKELTKRLREFLAILFSMLLAAPQSFSQLPQGPIPQKQDEEAPYALNVEVQLVNVDVVVADRDRNFIPGLRKEHFRVYVDGIEQEIVAFAPAEAPITAVLLVESTPRVGYVRYKNLNAAYLFLRHLRRDDWIALMGYDLRPHVEVDFTNNSHEIIRALQYMQFGGFSESNLYDAVIDALDRLKDVKGKKSLIIIGTGEDTFSKHIWDDARKAARESDVTIFAIGMGRPILYALEQISADPRYSRIAQQMANDLAMNLKLAETQLADFAKQTGGRAYFPTFITELPGIYGEIGSMLRNQYSLAFRPKPFKKDGKFHKIEVKLVAPDGKPLKVIDQNGKEVKYDIYAREGYFAPKQ